MSGVQCQGLTQDKSATTLEECAANCCGNPNCYTYQWCPSNGKDCSPQVSCWYGAQNNCKSGTGWDSYGRDTINATTLPVISINYDEKDFYGVTIPHDYVVNGTFSPTATKSHGYLPTPVAWYRKHFSLSNDYKNKALYIYFEGIYRDARIYINGEYIGTHESGYTSFYHYISWVNGLNYGDNSDNVLAIFVDPSHYEGWWYEGGGVYRNVRFEIRDYVHVQPWGIYVPSNVTKVNSDGLTGDGNAKINVTVVNNGTTAVSGISIQYKLYSPDDKQISTDVKKSINIPGNGEANVAFSYSGTDLTLWDVTQPELYKVNVQVLDSSNNVLDSQNETFGFRQFSLSSTDGYTLNGRHIKWQGVCNHQDFAGTGVAVPRRVNEFRVQMLQSMNVNSWRMSHNPPNPDLLETTDRRGIMVWDENRNFANNTQYINDLIDMIKRDRNHPSVLIWSLCNEGGCYEGSPESGPMTQLFEGILRQYDDTRPISAAMNNGWGDGMSKYLDIQGVNYNYGELSKYHSQSPNQAIISSESCSCVSDRGVYVNEYNSTVAWCSAYADDLRKCGDGTQKTNNNCISGCWTPIIEDEFVIGSFAWTGFDYKGEPTPYSWPSVNSHYGIIDIAGYPKDSYWYYRAWFDVNTPTIHILPDNWDKQLGAMFNNKVPLWVYTNCVNNSVVLELNGKNIGTVQQGYTNVVRFYDVPYETGNLTAKCVDKNSNIIVQTSMVTSSDEYGIKMDIQFSGMMQNGTKYIVGDGMDVAVIDVTIIDKNGIRVASANNMVNFEVVNGPGYIYGVGNGDPSCIESDKGKSRTAFHGKVRLLVASNLNSQGTIQVKATSTGLQDGMIQIPVVFPERGPVQTI